jgi:hypothetical protein
MLDKRAISGEKVYLEIDEETGVVTRLLFPMVYKVHAITEDERGNCRVLLMPSAAIHFLIKTDPNFDSIRATLQAALDNQTELLITETREEHEIIDARPDTGNHGDSVDSPTPPPDPPVSEARASDLFNLMKGQSCDPCTPSSDCIPFLYPDDGCWVRAHRMCYDMVGMGETPEKVWISGGLEALTPNHPDCVVSWGWHVAPTLTVTPPTGDDKRVIDPSLSPHPESKDAWKSRQGNPNASMRDSAWTEYWGIGTTDPNLTGTNYWLNHYRDELEGRCVDFGPPPYHCTRTCFFIIDRNTFSNSEIEAMLHVSAPAVIEAAFYVIVEGFKPEDLGFTSATMQVKPTLTVIPAVPGMTIEAEKLVFEYPMYLKRRQRLTWVYKISFANIQGFTVEKIVVTLQASLLTVSSAGELYLIKQPNPYEIDGETSWLSTDLRVFQIKTGESRFGVSMGSDPSAFITQVITNLNTGATQGQTFENNISTDQNTSRLELSQTPNGTPVYNYAVAKVRYRGRYASATDVRVFFRLFTVATTSLVYNPGTTYRRYEQGNTIIPLLGIVNGEVAAMPCFATPRINSATTSMKNQTDPANVQTIPLNPAGAEVIRYFGCWLDINQTQPQFPISLPPSQLDGPYPSNRKTIQELIRNEHQCLVSEIAFTPTPVELNATPSVSDKLAQRNLAIVESANPGLVASRLISQTFEIKPTSSKQQPDELMIDWGNVPEGTHAKISIPGVDSDVMLRLATNKYRSHRLARIDKDTLKCDAGGITYLPIPEINANLPGLLTINLPEGIKNGQSFRVVVRQLTGGPEKEDLPSLTALYPRVMRHVVGSFQLTIPVREKTSILPREQRLLSNLRWIQRSIPERNRWSSTFNKYVSNVADRVDALGGDSGKIAASPTGQWQSAYTQCRLLGLATALLTAMLLVAIGIQNDTTMQALSLLIAALLATTTARWITMCRPEICQRLKALIAGTGIATIILGLLALLRGGTTMLWATLAASAIICLGAAAWAWTKGCFKPRSPTPPNT